MSIVIDGHVPDRVATLPACRRMPTDRLRLRMADEARDLSDLRSRQRLLLLHLAHSFGRNIVAEGVEHQVAATQLTRHCCDTMQHRYARPPSAVELEPDRSVRDGGGPSAQPRVGRL